MVSILAREFATSILESGGSWRQGDWPSGLTLPGRGAALPPSLKLCWTWADYFFRSSGHQLKNGLGLENKQIREWTLSVKHLAVWRLFKK